MNVRKKLTGYKQNLEKPEIKPKAVLLDSNGTHSITARQQCHTLATRVYMLGQGGSWLSMRLVLALLSACWARGAACIEWVLSVIVVRVWAVVR